MSSSLHPPQSPPTHKHTDLEGRGCLHLPLSHHNTLFKLDTARSLFFLAEFIEPVQPDLPYQSVKGIFHSLQYETQLPSMFKNTGGHMGACVTGYRSTYELGNTQQAMGLFYYKGAKQTNGRK